MEKEYSKDKVSMSDGVGPVGLTMEEVNERVEQGLVNLTDITTDKSVWKIIQTNTLTYFNLIFLIITVLL